MMVSMSFSASWILFSVDILSPSSMILSARGEPLTQLDWEVTEAIVDVTDTGAPTRSPQRSSGFSSGDC